MEIDTNALSLRYALDTFYLLVSGALVMWMAAGFSMLEAGLVRAKNTAEILTKNLALYAVASITYVLLGYGIMYSEGTSILGLGLIPDLLPSLLTGKEASAVALADDGASRHAAMAALFFQVVFVATAMSIVSGAIAERMRLWSFLAFAVVMTGLIYPIQGYWTWGGGVLSQIGFSDFAGAGVVHLTGASAALAGVLTVGPRRGKYRPDGTVTPMPGANLPLAALGTLVLWFGWFGFNGGAHHGVATLQNADAVATIFVNTNLSAAAGLLAALVIARILFGKADLTMALSGALAGLVSITAEPLTPTPLWAAMIGAIGGLIVVLSIVMLDRFRIDDPVGAISVHGVVGAWGLLAVAITNDAAHIGAQLIGLGTILLWVFLSSLVVWGLIRLILGLRVPLSEEYEGLDVGECGLEAYPEFVGVKGSGL